MAHRWFVVRTEPRAEYLAANALGREGFETYLPRINAEYPRMGHADTPLFPGYMFLRFDPEGEGWPTFRPSHKVLGYIRSGDEIPSIPDATLNDLKERISAINDRGGMPIQYHEGDVVEVVNSSFNSLAEVLKSGKSSKGKVKVLLEFMGRLIHAEVPWQHVQPVTPGNNNPGFGSQRLARRTRGKGRWIRGAAPLKQAVRIG